MNDGEISGNSVSGGYSESNGKGGGAHF